LKQRLLAEGEAKATPLKEEREREEEVVVAAVPSIRRVAGQAGKRSMEDASAQH